MRPRVVRVETNAARQAFLRRKQQPVVTLRAAVVKEVQESDIFRIGIAGEAEDATGLQIRGRSGA